MATIYMYMFGEIVINGVFIVYGWCIPVCHQRARSRTVKVCNIARYDVFPSIDMK